MSAQFLLDTNIISHLVARRLPSAELRFARLSPDQILVSAISYGEVWFGLHRRPSKISVRNAMADFFLEAQILPWTRETADIYSRLRVDLERMGRPLGSLGLLIAAQALEAGATLVTNDRAFRHVPGLQIEDWTAE